MTTIFVLYTVTTHGLFFVRTYAYPLWILPSRYSFRIHLVLVLRCLIVDKTWRYYYYYLLFPVIAIFCCFYILHFHTHFLLVVAQTLIRPRLLLPSLLSPSRTHALHLYSHHPIHLSRTFLLLLSLYPSPWFSSGGIMVRSIFVHVNCQFPSNRVCNSSNHRDCAQRTYIICIIPSFVQVFLYLDTYDIPLSCCTACLIDRFDNLIPKRQ